MITRQAIEAQEITKKAAIQILIKDPYISMNQLEEKLRKINKSVSRGSVSLIYNRFRRHYIGQIR